MKDIMTLARECGATPYTSRHYPDITHMTFRQETLERFAEAVRNQALEDATEAATDAVAFNGGSVQMEAHVRQAISKPKEGV